MKGKIDESIHCKILRPRQKTHSIRFDELSHCSRCRRANFPNGWYSLGREHDDALWLKPHHQIPHQLNARSEHLRIARKNEIKNPFSFDLSVDRMIRRTFVHVVFALGHDGNEVRIYVFVQNRSIIQDASLWMNVLDWIFRCNFSDFLRIVESAQIISPDFNGVQ